MNTLTQPIHTTQQPTWLAQHAKDIYSQGGEDGVISAILELLPTKDSWCVEFGAWDGTAASNSRNLIESRSYSAVLIEARQERFDDLVRHYQKNKKVIPLRRYVAYSGPHTLDNILSETPIPKNFDVLSIDIDGNDYYVWESLSVYKPKVVCIEFNPTIPTEVDFVQEKNVSVSHGCSVRALARLGRTKGYELVSVLQFNAIFVLKEYYPLFKITDNSVQTLRTDLRNVAYLFTGYDGKVFLRGSLKLPWHGIVLKESRMQVLPRYLQDYPENYTRMQHLLFMVYIAFSFPKIFWSKMKILYTLAKHRRHPPTS